MVEMQDRPTFMQEKRFRFLGRLKMFPLEFRLKGDFIPLQQGLISFPECPYQDLCFVTDKGKIWAHKFVLAAHSKFLKHILRRLPEHVEAGITLADTALEDIRMVLELLYCGSTAVPHERRTKIVELLDTLGIAFGASTDLIKNAAGTVSESFVAARLAACNEQEIQKLLSPEVRLTRLTTDEIRHWTGSNYPLVKKRKAASVQVHSKRRKTDEPEPDRFDCPLCPSSFSVKLKWMGHKSRCPTLKHYTHVPRAKRLQCIKCLIFVPRNRAMDHLDQCEGTAKKELGNFSTQSSPGLSTQSTSDPHDIFLVDDSAVGFHTDGPEVINVEKEASGTPLTPDVSDGEITPFLPLVNSDVNLDSSAAMEEPGLASPLKDVKNKLFSPKNELKCSYKKKVKENFCKEYLCEVCNTTFASRLYLMLHTAVHKNSVGGVSSPAKSVNSVNIL